ncbi:hypothetical protein ZEAMMB73_Zm00001d000009 [Zea mays]|jgi:hypothetical protein|nr:hypothetical protein ZEAMMB73_Zm00001d000009 [Zea mays]
MRANHVGTIPDRSGEECMRMRERFENFGLPEKCLGVIILRAAKMRKWEKTLKSKGNVLDKIWTIII